MGIHRHSTIRILPYHSQKLHWLLAMAHRSLVVFCYQPLHKLLSPSMHFYALHTNGPLRTNNMERRTVKEYQKIFEHLQKVAAHHRFEADVCDQNILLIESVLVAIEDLNHRVEILEKQSPYDNPPSHKEISEC